MGQGSAGASPGFRHCLETRRSHGQAGTLASRRGLDPGQQGNHGLGCADRGQAGISAQLGPCTGLVQGWSCVLWPLWGRH